MSTGDTMKDVVAFACLRSKESSGSHDSVISMNSGFSEDSMEHLSAEERACIMYLEQTIEALEVQEDSGLSNDEPDSRRPPENMGLNKVNAISRLDFKTRMDQRSETLSTLLGGFPVGKKPVYISVTEENIAGHNLWNQTCEPNFTTAPKASTEALKASMTVISPPQVLVTDSVPGLSKSLDAHTEGLGLPTIDDSPNIIPYITPDLDLGLIPPPSAFRDDPGLYPEPDPEPDGIKASPDDNSSRPVSIDLKRLYQRALEKRPPVSPPANKKPTDKLNIKAHQSPLALESLLPMNLHPEAKEPQSPPSVAPKPKRLSFHSLYQTQTEVPNTPNGNSDRQPLNQERIHLEALQKIGLLKGSVTDPGPTASHKLSPQTRRSWVPLPAPSSPTLPSPSNLTPSYRFISSASPGSFSTASERPSVSTAFSDHGRPCSLGREQSSVNNILASSKYTQLKSPSLTSSDLVKQLTKVTGSRSGAMEHTGLRLSRPVDHHERISVERCLNHATSPDIRRRVSSSSALQHSRDSHKLPRPHGISVLIPPRDANGMDRRDALKKLGLIRD